MKTSFVPVDQIQRVTPVGPVGPAVPPSSGVERSHAAAAPRAIVIGSGFGGLAAAVRLSCKGYRVTVLEKLGGLGGRAGVWRQEGFTFDAGPTIITAPFMLEELWALCGKRLADDVRLVPMDPFYRIRFDDGHVFGYSGDLAQFRAELTCFDPVTWRATFALSKRARLSTGSASSNLDTCPSIP